jgi:hypothetical protein
MVGSGASGLDRVDLMIYRIRDNVGGVKQPVRRRRSPVLEVAE